MVSSFNGVEIARPLAVVEYDVLVKIAKVRHRSQELLTTKLETGRSKL
jgi:hypothetical protein